MDKKMEKELSELCQKHPDEVAQILLETPFWLKSLSPMTNYLRFDDDTYRGCISVTFAPVGDGFIEVLSEKDPDDRDTHRFRMPTGGGHSERVRTALLLLALAIKLDNEEFPQDRPPRN
ncbi:MAG: hypothetical protein Q7K26_06790 [bacterium]|nr:hypothetical protein [bacterium]